MIKANVDQMAITEKLNEKQIQALRSFYENEFSLEPALEILTERDFEKREWAFVDLNGKFNRNYSFSSPNDLLQYIRNTLPRSIYVGAVYSEGPDNRVNRSIHQVNWVRRELIFDIDLTEYDEVRPCSCRGKNQVCDSCWELVKTCAFWINDTLIEDFGIKRDQIYWIFSGRRGVHAWIKNDLFSILDNEQRSSIIDYMTLFKGTGIEVKLVEKPINLPANLRTRLIDRVYVPFFRECTFAQLKKIGFSDDRALFILKQRDTTEVDKSFISKFVFLNDETKKKYGITNYPSWESIEESIIVQWGPRIDAAVSKDIRRILRLPGSVHGNTGKVVQILEPDELDYFSPLDTTSIFDDY